MTPSCAGRKPSLLSPWRRRVQWLTSLLVLLLPWLKVGGDSLLRIDIPQLSLHLFGQILRIEELYLVLFFALLLGLGFLLLTLVLGRVWCGWLCPQTTLGDLAEWGARSLGLKVKQNRLHGPLWRKFVLHGFYLSLAGLIAANLLWYFIEPQHFFVQLSSLDLHYAAWMTLTLTALLVYLDLAVIRRLMCRDFCPYGRFQTALVDKATLTLHLPDTELHRCIECGSCVRACPMEIDIRRGYQVECINCGRCLDACRQVMARRNQLGLIQYTFGLDNQGWKALLNTRTLILTLAAVVLLAIFLVGIFDRAPASLKVSVSHTAAARSLADGSRATFFNAWINNRSQIRTDYRLRARDSVSGRALLLKGQIESTLDPGENRRLDFVVITSDSDRVRIEFVLTDRDGLELTIAEAYIEANVREEKHD